jgi:hypothetical protein
MSTQEEKTAELEKSIAADKSKAGLVEKIVFIILPVCVSSIGWLLTQVGDLQSKVTILENKVAVVVNAENKAIPPQGTTIEMETMRAAAAQARADLRLDLATKIMEVREDAAAQRALMSNRISILEERISHIKK